MRCPICGEDYSWPNRQCKCKSDRSYRPREFKSKNPPKVTIKDPNQDARSNQETTRTVTQVSDNQRLSIGKGLEYHTQDRGNRVVKHAQLFDQDYITVHNRRRLLGNEGIDDGSEKGKYTPPGPGPEDPDPNNPPYTPPWWPPENPPRPNPGPGPWPPRPIVDCTGVTITYTTDEMDTDDSQELSHNLVDGCDCYWATSRGSFNTTTSQTVTYTAPATNAECAENPIITIICNGEIMDTLEMNVTNGSVSGVAGHFLYEVKGRAAGICSCNIAAKHVYCDNSLSSSIAHYCNSNYNNTAPCTVDEMEAVQAVLCASSWAAVVGCVEDERTAAMKTNGCCPPLVAG